MSAIKATKAIKAEKLNKVYRTKVKAEGLSASFRALIKPERKEIHAVQDINLEVEQGDIVAFIGPNGAGKSTFIKMLCGILYPTSGCVAVLGMSPHKERRQLAKRIGTVFGQRSQLWLHLPAADSFTLLAAIYELSKTEKQQRVGELSEIFGLGDFINTPVRKLSLGQRIRCEIAASLLHEPEILFLDEPTIGLDVVVKQAIRELILRRNKEKGTTVFLTSHDPADIEQLCRRAVVINHGTLVLDTEVEKHKNGYISMEKAITSIYQLETDKETLS
jgi:ABC-2 type transport system ATP-binding protein